MKNKLVSRQSPRKGQLASAYQQLFKLRVLIAVVLLVLIIISVIPAGAVPTTGSLPGAAAFQAESTLTFTAEADARVQQSNPGTTYGTANYLLVDGANNPDVESFLRFTVNNVTGGIQRVTLRVYVTTNASANGPAVYAAGNNWTETGITWNNRPGRTSSALDNKGSTNKGSWVEYNVTAAVTGNGTYTFVLVADSSDAIRFSSREGSRAPQLVVTSSPVANTPTAAQAPSSTSTSTPTATPLPSETSASTGMPTNASPPGPTATDKVTATPTGAAAILTFTPNADARLSEASPGTNYGTSSTLQADGNAGDRKTSYIRFTTTGISGPVQRVTLRVFCTTNGTTDGPAVSLADNTWNESGTGGITWNNRPALVGAPVDNKTAIEINTWVEYDVTSLVTGNGTYTFALVADSTDGVTFSSREGGTAPELIVTLGAGSATDVPTQRATATQTVTQAATQQASPTASIRVVNLTPVADAYVDSSSPSANYGTQTQLRGNASPVVRSYLRFDVQGVSGTVTRATLRLFANTSSSSGYEIRSVGNNTWNETTLTYNNSPAVGGMIAASGSFNAGAWTTVDITSYINGNGTYTLALTVPGTPAISFASRETGNNAPRLVLETQGGTPPAATATRTPTAAATLPPQPTQDGSVVLVGAGDITSCSRTQDDQTAQLLDNIPGTVFTAGDNAYVSGTYTEFLNCYDPTWGRHKSRTKPSPGNHEYQTSGAAGYFQYFNNIPSYYAYDLGAWRIYSLNSEISVSATSPQVTWLQDDLAANPRQCVLAYWHKPRWSSGANHGDNSGLQTIWQILYNAGAELVINGHEHQYERFGQLNATGAPVSQGLREIVAGTGGASLYPFGTPLPGSEVRNNTSYGVLKLTLHPDRYEWQFIPIPGSTLNDSGTSDCH